MGGVESRSLHPGIDRQYQHYERQDRRRCADTHHHHSRLLLLRRHVQNGTDDYGQKVDNQPKRERPTGAPFLQMPGYPQPLTYTVGGFEVAF